MSRTSVAVGPDRRAEGLLSRWFWFTTIGELAGFLAPAVVGVVTASWSPWVAVPSVVAAGFIEGLVLGAAQATAFAAALPRLRRRRFALNTAVAAALAYVVGLGPSTWASRVGELPIWVVSALGAVGGVVLLAPIGFAQWLELRRLRPNSTWWIASTALGWLVGLVVFLLVASPLWHEGQPTAEAVLVGLIAGAVMAISVALVTGVAAVRLVTRSGGTKGPARIEG